MEIRNFLLLVKKHRLSLILIPLFAVILTYVMVRQKPNNYQSQIQIATGIVDQSQQVISTQQGYVPDSKILEEFTNLIETMKLNKVVDQVSFKLFLHDLINQVPYKSSFAKYVHLSHEQKAQFTQILTTKINNFGTLDLNSAQEKVIDSLIAKVGYDRESLLKNIVIYRIESSDFIAMDVNAESPELSSFIANELTDRFITYYSSYVDSGHNRANDFFGKLLKEKKEALNLKTASLEAFKVKNGILDVGDESKDIYTQISDLETHEQQAEKDVIAYSGALKSIDAKFDPKDRQYLEATSTKINGVILSTRERLRVLNDKYVQSNFNPRFKKSIDSLQEVLSTQINESSDKYISNPMVSKDNLVQEKLKMQNELELARYSQSSLNKQITSLKSKMSTMVPAQAAVKSFDRDIDIATKEYLDVQDKYNQANVTSNAPVQLRQLQPAMPGKIKSSKKILIVGLSGVTTLIIYLMVLLIIFYLDNSIRNAEDLERISQLPVLGHLNIVPNMTADSYSGKKSGRGRNDMHIYRNLLRSIRFEIDTELQNGKVLSITSLDKGEGKTLFSFSLAYAYSLTNKRVLLIDGNFSNPVISQTVKSKDFVEDFFGSDRLLDAANEQKKGHKTEQVTNGEEKKLLEINSPTSIGETIQRLSSHSVSETQKIESITVLGNKGGDVSILEINNELHIQNKMDELRAAFDIIIIEAGSLSTMNKSKEWIAISDKTLAIFENNKGMSYTSLPAINYLRGLNGNMLGWVLNKVEINSVQTS